MNRKRQLRAIRNKYIIEPNYFKLDSIKYLTFGIITGLILCFYVHFGLSWMSITCHSQVEHGGLIFLSGLATTVFLPFFIVYIVSRE